MAFADCKTKEECLDFFQQHNNMSPQTYATLALAKLRPSNPFFIPAVGLAPQQQRQLEACGPDATWDMYCHSLTVEQLLFIGW
jgi:hypothetical protein